MRRIFISLLTLLILSAPISLAGYSYASGVDITPQCDSTGELSNQGTSFCPDVNNAETSGSDPIISIIKVVMEIISFITGVAAVILIMVSGIRFMTSGGDAGKLAAARGALINALIGIAVTVLAQSIVVFVIDKVN